MEKIIVVGDGITAISAIKAIREVDKDSEIEVFGDEEFYPYNRIRLSKGLLGSLEEDKLLLQKRVWYEENEIKLQTDTRVMGIDVDEKQVKLSDGKKINYSKLLLANGATNMIPAINGINKRGVVTLRTLKDARDIVELSKDNNIILNIGGGILSLELAWVLSQTGKKVIISELLPRLMPKQLDERASNILRKSVEAQEIDILLNNQISEISVNENGVEGIISDSGKFTPCNMVTYSIGIKPNIDIINGAAIKCNKGIIINDKMETSVPGIYAAGDVAEFDGRILGLWNIAIGQGTTAGYNIAGKETVYKPIAPVTTLSAFGISLFSMGNIDESFSTNTIVEDEEEKNSYKKIFIKDNKIIGAIVIGNTKSSPILKKAIEEEIILDEVNFSNVYVDELIEKIRGRKS